jgi:hypothetical protein
MKLCHLINLRFSISIDRAIREEWFLVPLIEGESEQFLDSPRIKAKTEEFKSYLESLYKMEITIVDTEYIGLYSLLED